MMTRTLIARGILISSFIFVLGSCAEERDVEKVYDFDGNRFDKATLLSSDQWMYKATVIETSQEGGFAFVGISTPLRVGRFEFAQDRLRFVNNVATFEDGGQGNTPDLINSWEIKHSDYRLRESNGKVTNVEEENNTIPWSEKRFFKIDWTSHAVDELGAGNSCFEKVYEEIVDGSQEVTPEHFTFTLETTYELKGFCVSFPNLKRRQNSGNFTYTMRVKYSFAPLPESDYKPLVYENEFDERRKKYGFFETVVDRMNEKKGRFEKEVLANRWHPEKEHTIYFAEDFPEEYKWIYNDPTIGIGTKTNKIFEDHGLKIRFHFKSDPNVKFGDVRYSFVKFVEKPDETAPLGFGPSDTHPLTGEILRSDSIIWTSSLKYYVDRIRENEKEQPSREENQLFLKIKEALESADIRGASKEWLAKADRFHYRNDIRSVLGIDELSEEEVSQRLESRAELQKIIGANLFVNPAYAYSTYRDPFDQSKNDFSSLDTSLEPGDRYEVRNDVVSRTMKLMSRAGVELREKFHRDLLNVGQNVRKFQHQHGEVNLHNWRNVKDPTCIYPIEGQLAAIRPMIQKGKSDEEIIDTILYRVAIHELGHNLNLRHNFYGSVDYMNFSEPRSQVNRNNEVIKDENGKILYTEPVSSSVMDYLTLTDEYHVDLDWENYDKAALVYGYSEGKIDIDTMDLVGQNEDGSPKFVKREKARQFLFCTDEHRAWNNPFCNTFDRGSTASEVIFSMIENYDRAYEIRNKPYDRAYWDTRGYESSVAGDLLNPFKFLKYFEDINMFLDDMTDESEFIAQGRVDDRMRIRDEITDDAKRAAVLLAAYYSGVVQLANSERNIIDNVDARTGNVLKLGILYDKLYAMIGLGGSFPISIENDGVVDDVNFLKHMDEKGELGLILREVLPDIAVDNIELVVNDFDSFGRSLFAQTAMVRNNRASDVIKRMQIKCYTKAALKQRFGIDADRFYPYYEGHPFLYPITSESDLDSDRHLTTLNAAQVRVGGVSSPKVGLGRYPILVENDYNPIAGYPMMIVRDGDRFYTAVEIDEKTGYAYEFMRRSVELEKNEVSRNAKLQISQSKLFYDYSVHSESQPCIDYQYGFGE